MPDLTAAELSIPAEQHPDPAKPLVIPVDSTVVGSTLRFIPWSVVGNPAFLQLPPPPPGMQPSWVQIPQWVAISALLPFSEPEPAVATHFDRLSVLRLAVLAAAWRRILGALSDLGVFSTVHVDEDAFRTVCIQALHSRQIPVPELYLQWGDLGYSEAITPLGPAPSAEAKAVDFLQYATVGALCDPTADVPFAALSDMTRCLGPVFTAAARVDPMGSAVVGAASLAAAAGGDRWPSPVGLMARNNYQDFVELNVSTCGATDATAEVLTAVGNSQPEGNLRQAWALPKRIAGN
ncbi:hypothetical protein EMIHUDRAFT_219680 [Emiliania huxleyi CCMP1516]|uniref:Uncharacterized protein n=2 Tax=Emiliania huxleyi TaxID=2903 RepID=A0A0D3I3X4_EMIH1|nr:hypothetical protein EMIHUDRAFT_219680 [Emiliania huxleyi CCMP1516]EOD05959.1 hypothetical protein EMIHUDRAFT_219680 [Emiliania huxleyi CCMP1516]|eukprot:XP_005758388.1 hypothetical protein EMIHUDRAFT_219680 [Emiliania huxleyi CCMP1516]